MKRSELIDKYSKLLHLKNYSTRTEKLYLHHLNLFLDYVSSSKIVNINEKTLLDYFDHLKQNKNFSYSSMKQALASVRFLFLDVLKKEIDFDFFIKMKKPNSLPNILTTEEVKNIINSIVNLKHRAIISTIYSCGLRISEAVNLKISDVDSSAMTIKIVNAKGKNDRIVMLSKKLLKLLREYFKEYKPKTYLFEGQSGEKYSARSIQQIFNNTVNKVRIKKKVTVHSLRHSFASHLLDSGTDIRFIQELLGHKHLSTTQIYTHINPTSVKKIKSPFDSF
ncbi:MAG: site-specific integrase [Ignavibacterium album]|jgi:site-specific recombinase XerD|uniref:site-specific tyrosine recombinase/integron integrase n=1 Tax=Ignavibacterium album TaxID=591197 RepID=UPI0026EC3946|nr:site-specific tyrosine recombinase/integron integrase [Ignavibacterium album]MBI5661754.1 site-specific integrase [Ignavibacterium album]